MDLISVVTLILIIGVILLIVAIFISFISYKKEEVHNNQIHTGGVLQNQSKMNKDYNLISYKLSANYYSGTSTTPIEINRPSINIKVIRKQYPELRHSTVYDNHSISNNFKKTTDSENARYIIVNDELAKKHHLRVINF